jgi:hypothetical protein
MLALIGSRLLSPAFYRAESDASDRSNRDFPPLETLNHKIYEYPVLRRALGVRDERSRLHDLVVDFTKLPILG